MRHKNITSEMMKEYMAEALLILLEKKDFEDITIEEITKKAGVNRSTYYRNFKSKDEIVKFFFTKIIREYLASISQIKEIKKEAYLRGIFSGFMEKKPQLLLLYRRNVSHYVLDALNEMFVLITESITFQEYFTVFYHTGGIFNSLQLWFSEGMNASAEVMTQAVMSILPSDFAPMLKPRQ